MSSLEIAQPFVQANTGPVVVARGVFVRGGKALLSQRLDGQWHFPGGKVEDPRILEVLGKDADEEDKLLRVECARESTEEVGISDIMFHGPFVRFENRLMSGGPPYGGRRYLGYCAVGDWNEGFPQACDETKAVQWLELPRVQSLPNLRADSPIILAALNLL